MAGKDVYLLYGKSGWIGGMLINLLKQQGKIYHLGQVRLENRESVAAELDRLRPTHVLNAAGVTGMPNVDWCETHQPEAIRSNVIGGLNLADLCHERGIHMTLYGTGCIYEYDDEHPCGSGVGFKEEEKANFAGSFYSKTKGYLDEMLKSYSSHVCILRLRMPISNDLSPRNFITKICQYERVVNIPNSMTVLSELLPISLIMAERRLTGTFNFCNPGAISHNQCLDLYTEIVDPDFYYTNFTLEDQRKILVAQRSNNELDESKLIAALPDIKIDDIHTAMRKVMHNMKANLIASGDYPHNLPKRRGAMPATEAPPAPSASRL
eukprot:CAMPEP_0171078550 /NCGR_PEP_ID=MMETSP0766_2-20121228/14709_1 /TAXON_ID=439317 /ORGANISM="Gambierdiscus australes, Strain CAWD 149" /LENGTH=322 /DNA_ID=CAMNT_0011535689 /DNA_START=54 /DNA_END=1022 /DNA_ORIENTATION=-